MPPSQTNVLTDCIIDYLTCGGCASEFPLQNITNFIQHKKVGCLDTPNLEPSPISGLDGPDENALLCFTCSRDFMTARGLLQHIQLSHNLKVFLQPGEEQEQSAQQGGQTDQQTDQQTDTQIKTVKTQSNSEWNSQSSGSGISSADKKACSDVVDIPRGHTVEITSGRRQSDTSHHNSDYEQDETTAGRTTICCNSQECCVTIIPGTHERPKKCCSAVVPKKRKQHMAEHMGSNCGDQESSDDRESDQNEDNETQGEDSNSNSIFIDFHPQFRNFDQNSVKGDDSKTDTEGSVSQSNKENEVLPASTVNESFGLSAVQEVTKLGSLIMHPGKTYSIPVSYAYSVTDLQILNNRSIKIFPQTLDGGEKNGSFTIQTNDASSVGSGKLFDVPAAEIQQISASNVNISQGVPVAETTVRVPKENKEACGATQEAEYDDSDKEDEMEIDESLADRGRKRRYPTSRPFKCSQCDHAFNQRIHLKKHMSKHTGVKPFKCAQCSYATVERSHLKVHIRIHTGEKPFKCTFCKYATAQNSTLKIHLKRHHNGKMLECEDCHKQFTQHEMLTNHRMGHQQSGISSQPISGFVTSGDRGEPPDRANQLPRLTGEPISSVQTRAEETNQLQAVYELTNQSVNFSSSNQSKS